MKNNKSMTLIELLAALVVAGLLLAASMSAVANIARSNKLATNTFQPSLDRNRLSHLLQQDLLHATHWRNTEDGFELQTWMTLEGRTLNSRHLLSTVHYQVRQVDSQKLLIRTQAQEGVEPWSELLSRRVARVALMGDGAEGSKPPRQWQPCPATRIAGISMADDVQSFQLTVRRE